MASFTKFVRSQISVRLTGGNEDLARRRLRKRSQNALQPQQWSALREKLEATERMPVEPDVVNTALTTDLPLSG